LEQIAKYASVFFGSMIKFILGPITGLLTGLNFFETFMLTMAGMMTSVVIFSFVGRKVGQSLLKKYYKPAKSKWTAKIRIWVFKHGVYGIAFLTPIIFSPIIGTLLASSITFSRSKLLISMLLSAIFWSFAINIFFYGFKSAV
jgi:dipeptide/tripeptide permease